MSKEKNRGNRENRKPKKVEPKVNASKPTLKGIISADPKEVLAAGARKGR